MFKRLIASLVCLTFSFTNLQYVHAQDFSINQLPAPGTMVGESAPFAPLTLKGLIVNPQKPLEFQFIVDTGHGPQDTASIKEQANQLVKYFLAGLTIPEGDLWVNLSPYEKDRMVPTALGQTDLGRDLLAQDYILKQLTASLIYPEKDLGKEFWSRVYAKAQQQFGTTNIPVNTFNKVWILPDQAQVYENVNAAYVTKSTLKVMLDEDYLAKQKHQETKASSISSQIVKEIVLPEIAKEVNTGKNFAPLRQIYQALILAKWYKETIQNGLLDALYTNKNKVAGVNLNDSAVKEQIYERYLKAYKKGTFNYIKEDPTLDGQVVPRKYFSGGIPLIEINLKRTQDPAMVGQPDGAMMALQIVLDKAMLNQKPSSQDAAMTADALELDIIKLMQRLKLKDNKRFLTTMNMSVDTVFINELAKKTGSTVDDILAELEKIDFFKPIVYLYRMRNPKTPLNNEDFRKSSVDITVSDGQYGFQGQGASLRHEGHELFEYMKYMGQQAGQVPFAFRDDMKKFVGRFLGLEDVTENTTGFPDLLDIVNGLETNFLNKIELGKTKYLLTSGIGANEMYSHQLSEYLLSLGIIWIVVNNPDHMDRIPSDATNDNTIVFEMSRSGTTQETFDFFQRTAKKFTKRVVAAVQGQLRTTGEQLAKEKDAVVYSITDIPGYIGGRQMNRKTLMVAAPLFLALAVGYHDTEKAREGLKQYFSGLYAANEELAYKNQDNNPAVKLAGLLLTQRNVGRNKIQLLFSGSLKGLANETYQLANEGAQKYVAGGYENNNLVYEYNLNQPDDVERHKTGLEADPKSVQPLFLLDKSSDDYEKMEAYADQLKAKGLPVIVVTVDLKKGKSPAEVEQNLKTIARTSALMQDAVVYFTYLTRQDANSNPAVKLVRELTGVAKIHIAGIRQAGAENPDIRMTIQDFQTAMETSNSEKLAAAQKSFVEEGETQVESHQDFGSMKQAMGQLAKALNISEEDVIGQYLGSITKSVMQIDIGEAANTNTAKIKAAFELAKLNNQLGTLSAERRITPVTQQRMLLNTQAERVSIGLEEGEQFNTTGSIEEELAQYLYNSWSKNKGGLDNLVLTYMERDEGNPVISAIAKRMAKSAAKVGLQTPMFFLPGRAHSGIEGLMARAQKAINISIIYTQADKTENGNVDIGGITVNDATYMYGISNVIRMFLGGSRGIILEVKNAEQLKDIQTTINNVMDRFDAMVEDAAMRDTSSDLKWQKYKERYDVEYAKFIRRAGAQELGKDISLDHVVDTINRLPRNNKIIKIAVEGFSGALKSTMAQEIVRRLNAQGRHAVYINGDWFIGDRNARRKQQDSDLSSRDITVKVPDIPLREDKFVTEVLEKIDHFNLGKSSQLALDLQNLFNYDEEGRLTRTENLALDRNTVLVVDHNYLLLPLFKKYFDYTIRMLVRPSIGFKRRASRDSFVKSQQMGDVYWRIHVPSMMEYLRTNDVIPNITITTDRVNQTTPVSTQEQKPLDAVMNADELAAQMKVAEDAHDYVEYNRLSDQLHYVLRDIRGDPYYQDDGRYVGPEYWVNGEVDPRAEERVDREWVSNYQKHYRSDFAMLQTLPPDAAMTALEEAKATVRAYLGQFEISATLKDQFFQIQSPRDVERFQKDLDRFLEKHSPQSRQNTRELRAMLEMALNELQDALDATEASRHLETNSAASVMMTNAAALAKDLGGIDLNQINVLRNGKTVNVQFDPAQLNKLMQGGFEGFTPVIINIQHISSPFELLGINPAKEEVLVKV